MINAVSENIKKLLTELFDNESLYGFCLIGGTNLALKYAYRVSTDIDLLLYKGFCNIGELELKLKESFKERIIIKSIHKNMIRAEIDDIKVDCLDWHKEKSFIDHVDKFENSNWLLAKDMDIAAMKMNAIIQRGNRKDFYDMAFLINKYSLRKLVDAYCVKYQVDSDNAVVNYLNDFYQADIENDSTIKTVSFFLNSWQEVKQYLKYALANYIKEN